MTGGGDLVTAAPGSSLELLSYV